MRVPAALPAAFARKIDRRRTTEHLSDRAFEQLPREPKAERLAVEFDRSAEIRHIDIDKH